MFHLVPRFFLPLIMLYCVRETNSQGNCQTDGDCAGDDNCCSAFGFCGTGDGFCTPSSRIPAQDPPRTIGNTRTPARDPPRTSGGNARIPSVQPPRRTAAAGNAGRRFGSGCVLSNSEFVGGDLPAILGGGGVKIDQVSRREPSSGCFQRCEETPACKWYTWDNREKLCYLKSKRGYLRNRTDDFTSGATFSDGCDRDPACEYPYTLYSDQCLFFSLQDDDDGLDLVPSLADVRRNLNRSREICRDMGGFLPYDYIGYSSSLFDLDPILGDQWTWTGFPSEGEFCFARRPGRRFTEGVRRFPCSANLPFSCQRGVLPPSVPVRPNLYTPRARCLQRPGCRRQILRNRILRRRLLERRRLLTRERFRDYLLDYDDYYDY